jgi:ABC-type transport system substrate-binding protein
MAERILVRSFETPEDAYAAYVTGRVDIAPVPDSRLGEAQAGVAGYTGGSTPQITYLAFDPAHPATADPRFRHAVSLAIDRLVIIDAAYGDQRRPATRWLPGDYGSGIDSTCADFARRIGDPDRAKQLLSASGFQPASVRIPLFYDSNTTARVVAEALQLQVKEALGVTLVPEALEGEDIAASFKARGAGPAAWIMATSIELPLPDQFLGDLFRTGSENNLLQFSDRTFDARVSSARTATASADIERFYVQAENALCNQMPAIPLWTSVSHWLINPDKVEFEGERTLDLLGGPILRHAQASA